MEWGHKCSDEGISIKMDKGVRTEVITCSLGGMRDIITP